MHLDAQTRLANAALETNSCARTRLPFQARSRTLRLAPGPRGNAQPRESQTRSRRHSRSAHEILDCEARKKDGPRQPDLYQLELARQRMRPVQDLSAGV